MLTEQEQLIVKKLALLKKELEQRRLDMEDFIPFYV